LENHKAKQRSAPGFFHISTNETTQVGNYATNDWQREFSKRTHETVRLELYMFERLR
jgi:hypothetical protein